ncbi:MAG: Beta-galactosidase III [Candidatus Latescibacteria bacterium ADurb.Bin168]|nr:MAG: Beta-galactosidase III [Candidatus Latescibacteria bacterium ADurb.Bin168]
MAEKKQWSASIAFADTTTADGISLRQGVGRKTKPITDNRTVVPAHVSGRACARAVPSGKKGSVAGYWRGTSESVDVQDGVFWLQVENPPAHRLREVYVTIDFFESELGFIAVQYHRDGLEGFVHHVCPPGAPRPWDSTWVNTLDTGSWQRATIRLVEPVFDHSGFHDADLKIIGSGPLVLSMVRISEERPEDFSDTDQMAHARRAEEHLSQSYPKASIPVSIGNIGAIFEERDDSGVLNVPPWLPLYKGMGVTAIQSYVRWSSIEREEGVWDWTFYDWVVAEAKKFGLKWVAFIMIGPWYAMPKWWLATSNNYRNRCLEHGQESWVQSIWSPVQLDYVERFMRKFAEHYPEELIESIMVGISGDFGESTTNGVFTGDMYHTHVGYWCGEDVAVADFRRTLREKYGSIGRLNEAWASSFGSFDEIRPVVRKDAPSDRAWIDQINWYCGQMTWWMQRWGEICHEAMPNTVFYNAAGGAGDPPRAAHWTDQTRALKHTGMGHRATNEGCDYAFNYVYTAWQGVGCRFYGVPFGNEPWGGDMAGNGVLGRVFNLVTQQGTNFWSYEGHLHSPSGRLALQRGLPFLNGEYRRVNRVAVFYPWTHFVLADDHGFSEQGMRDRFWPQAEELRDIIDYDLIDDGLIKDGIMEDYDFLVILQGSTYEGPELERLYRWVENGGVLITHNLGVPSTVEGDLSLGLRLLAFEPTVSPLEKELGGRICRVGKGCAIMLPVCANRKGYFGDDRWADDHKDHPATHPAFWDMLTETLANASRLDVGLEDYAIFDGVQDEVYGALMERAGVRGVMFFSQVNSDVTKTIRLPGGRSKNVIVPAGQMVFAPFEG